MDHGVHTKREKHPKENANIFSLLTFGYMFKLLWQGFRKDISEDDVYQITKKIESKRAADKLEKYWEYEKFNNKHPSIFKTILKCYGKRYFLLGLTQLFVESCANIFRPFAVGKLVHYFTPGQTEISSNDAYFYACFLLAVKTLVSVYEEHYSLAKAEMALEMRMGLSSLMYRKALKLQPGELSEMTTGKIVTMITKDLQSIDLAIHFGNEFWVEILQGIFMCYLIYRKVGIATVVCVAAFAITFPVQAILGKLVYDKRGSTNKLSDKRMHLTQEVLSVIRIIKMYTWEKFFSDQIKDARKTEMKRLRAVYILKDGTIFFGGLISNLSYYLLLIVHVAIRHHLTAEVVYYIASSYGKIRFILTFLIPLALSEFAELLASMKRINVFMNAAEYQPRRHMKQSFLTSKILLRDANISIKEQEILKKVSLNLEKGLNLVMGPVGSGKSILMKTLLGEFKVTSGNFFLNGEVSYASQQPWLFPGTVKQNIIFGSEFEESRYNKVLEACSLTFDLKLLPQGDMTIIGDSGTNFSKGQQARINLARAIYKKADIYLLDDSLSSLDVNVQSYIFKKCVQNFLENKLVVLVTHNHSFVSRCNNITILGSGTVQYSGKFDDVAIQNYYNETHSLPPKIDEEILPEKIIPLLSETPKKTKEEKQIDEVETCSNPLYKEVKQEGSIDWMVYKRYIQYGGWVLFGVCLVLHILCELAYVISEKLVSKWVNMQQYNTTSLTQVEMDNIESSNNKMMYVIIAVTVLGGIIRFGRDVAHYIFSFIISKDMHKALINSILYAKVSFFDENLIGNVLNRFSKDLSLIDEYVPYVVVEVIRTVCITVSTIGLIISVNLLFLYSALIMFAIFIGAAFFYIPSARSLKRLDAMTRSPIVGQLNATIDGLVTIRAFQRQEILKQEYDKHQNLYASTQYMLQTTGRLFSLFLHLICIVFVATMIFSFLLFNTGALAGDVGLALSSAVSLGAHLQWGIRNWIQLESSMTSVERVIEYIDTEQEQVKGKEVEDWPNKGAIDFKKVCLTYHLNNQKVLKDLELEIMPKEKIGIVGRTGAGKSSIILALYRFYKVDGDIIIDRENTSSVSLKALRSGISIIPQEPVIFTGTVRSNMDPFNIYSDEEIWKALESVGLKVLVNDLNTEISNNSSYSLGEKQLFSVARAVLMKNKILVLDEATANMDKETEKEIHSKVMKIFKDCTIIIIAHRLETILDCDKVCVLDQGEIMEIDNPKALAKNKNSRFYDMIKNNENIQEYLE